MRAGRYAELQLPVIEALHRYEIGLAELPARTVRRCGTEWTFARIGEVTSGADHIFLSVDVDVLDPAHAPGVGWHEPGGLTSGELLDLLVALAPRVGGFALNEVNPLTDAGPKTTILAANLVSQFAVAAVGRNEDDECSFSRGLRYRVRACAKCCEPAAQSHLWCEGWRRL